MGKIFGGNFALEFLQSRKIPNLALCCCYCLHRGPIESIEILNWCICLTIDVQCHCVCQNGAVSK